MKKLFLVGGPPACGKTSVSRLLTRKYKNAVYLDKDAVIVLSNAAYTAAGLPISRDDEFFKKYLRDAEYEAILEIAIQSLEFNNCVIVNAPFTKEFRDPQFIDKLQDKLSPLKVKIIPVWTKCPPELCKKRLVSRNSERDVKKLEDIDAFIASQDFSIPKIKGIQVVDTINKKEIRKCLASIKSKS